MTDLLVGDGVERDLENRAQPLRALYEHWERTRWSLGDLSYEVDRASFDALGEDAQEQLRWLFVHRFDGEATVARLMTPFVAAAPDLDVGLLMSTQLVDEMRHVKAIVRIYDEVFGISGGMPAVQAFADARRDPFTARLYARLEGWLDALAADGGEDAYLRAVTAYHVIGEGVVARVSTQLSTPVFREVGDFPGIVEGQRLVSRDESRHIGIGVTYARREVARRGDRARALIREVVTDSLGMFTDLASHAEEQMGDTIAANYGATPSQYLEAAGRLLAIRMRAIGL